MFIPNDDTQNYFCRLQLVDETFGHSTKQPIKTQLKSPKLLGQRIRKSYYKTLGTSVINMPISSSFLNSDSTKSIDSIDSPIK